MSESNTTQNLVCHKCGGAITSSIEMKIFGNPYCSGCYSEISRKKPIVNESSTNYPYKPYKNKYSNALDIIAVSELLFSIIAAFYIWVEFGTVDLGMYAYTENIANPIGIGIGFGVLIQGIVLFILLSALKIMADDIAEVKNKSISK